MSTLDKNSSKNNKAPPSATEVNYKTIFETLLDTFYRTDADGYIVIVSPSVADLLGFSPEELIGTKLAELYADADGREKFLQALHDSGGEIRGYEIELRHKNGNPVWVATSSHYYRDEDGQVLGIEGVARDITRHKQGETALNKMQMDLVDAQRIAQLGSWELDLTSGLLTWSDEIYRIFEIDPQTFSASYEGFLEAIYPDDREMVNAAYLGSLENREPYSVLHRLKMPDGRIKWVQEHCESKFDGSGKPLSSRGTVHDITDIKTAERIAKESEARLKEILNIAPGGVITVGANMNIQLFNQGAERLFGYSAEEVIGHSMEILMPRQFREKHKRHVMAFESSPDTYRLMDQRDEIKGLRKDGTEFPASASVSQLEINGEKIFTIMLHDISESRQAEEERRKALAEAEKASQAKSEFLATMSHELRTPLNAIGGFSDMLIGEFFGALGSPKYTEYANDIRASSDHLLHLVNDILDLSVIEAGELKLNKEAVSVEEIVKDCSRFIIRTVGMKDIRYAVDVSANLPSLHVDKKALKQILINLLSNSVKFTSEGGQISLSAKVLSGHHIFQIRDNGPGVPKEKLQHLTEPFVRGETDPHKAQKGTGLGLAIVKSLVDLHDGQLTIESEVGKGTVVTVSLPGGSS